MQKPLWTDPWFERVQLVHASLWISTQTSKKNSKNESIFRDSMKQEKAKHKRREDPQPFLSRILGWSGRLGVFSAVDDLVSLEVCTKGGMIFTLNIHSCFLCAFLMAW